MAARRPPGHYSVQEAAEELGIHQMTVHKWIRAEELPSIKVANKRWIPREAVRSLKRRLEQPKPRSRRLPDRTNRPQQDRLI